MMLILVATKLCASDSWALGNIVNKATRKVPTIAITLGNKFLAFSTGSSLIKNKIVIKNMKPTVDTREASVRSMREDFELILVTVFAGVAADVIVVW